MRNKNIAEAFKNAFNGIFYTTKNEKNFRIELSAAILVLLSTLFLELHNVEFVIILLVIGLVLQAELFNTSIESVIDLYCGNEYNEFAKIGKDTSAAGVLIISAVSIIVGIFILIKKIMYNATTFKRLVKISGIPDYFLSVMLIVTGLLFMLITGFFASKNKSTDIINILVLLATCIATVILLMLENNIMKASSILFLIINFVITKKKGFLVNIINVFLEVVFILSIYGLILLCVK